MTNDELHADLHDTYMKYYAEGFKTNNLELIDRIVVYPIAYINAGSVEMCSVYPIDPGELKKEKQWDHSTEWNFEITGLNEHSAHAVASAVRRRKDGTQIENVHGFYAFTMTEQGWKMYAVADVTF